MDNIHPNERLPYSAIIDREPLKLPNNATVCVVFYWKFISEFDT